VEDVDDDSSILSGITMDIRLIQGARNWDSSNGAYDSDEDEDAEMPLPRRRPEPSVGGDDPYADSRPDPGHRRTRRTPSTRPPSMRSKKPPPIPSSRQSFSQNKHQHEYKSSFAEDGGVAFDGDGYPISNNSNGWNNQNDMLPPGGMDALFKNRSGNGSKATPSRQNGFHTHGEIHFKGVYDQSKLNSHENDQYANDNIPRLSSLQRTNSGTKVMDNFPTYNENDDAILQSKMQTNPLSYPSYSAKSILPPNRRDSRVIDPNAFSRPHGDDQYAQNRKHRQSVEASRMSAQRGQPDEDVIEDRMVNNSNGVAHSMGGLQSEYNTSIGNLKNAPVAVAVVPSAERVASMMQILSSEDMPSNGASDSRSPSRKQKEQSIHDISVILHCLNREDASSNLREHAFNSLAEILWKSGEKARDFIIQYEGIDTLVKAMWEDMPIINVQDAALYFLFSLAASSDGRASSDLLSKEDSICDALLFSMQTHPHVHSIQLKGCSILACLASASSNNKQISDGSLSGALMITLNAMNTHRDSNAIQKAGIQTLLFQCSLSEGAESNKRSLVESTLGNGSSGLDLLLSSMTLLSDDTVAMEWACKIFWCLTSSEDLVKAISLVPAVIHEVLRVCQQHISDHAAAALVEASFGVFGNLAHLENIRLDLHQAGVPETIVHGMGFHQNDYGVNIEACSAIANTGLFPSILDSVVAAGGVDAVAYTMQVFIDHADCVAEALRALICIATHSPESKQLVSSPDIILSIVQAAEKHHASPLLQEMTSILIASLAMDSAATNVVLDSRGVNVLIQGLLSEHSEEKVQDALVLALRNLTCQVDNGKILLQPKIVDGIVKSMQAHPNSSSIQANGCCCLWNLTFKSPDSPGTIIGADGVKSIVKAMQCNLESGEVLEKACAILWNTLYHPDDRERGIVGSGAIDAVACAMVMHPNRISTLENACGVLSSASLEESLVEAIGDAQAVSIVAEAMRANGSALRLLQIGCVALRNIVSLLPIYAQEASAAVSVVINTMKNNMNALRFQREACNLLWVLAAQSKSCQSKILALDGVAVLMKCLEHNSDDAAVNSAALGAFNQIASKDNEN
jgi:hypothetical protein